MSDYPDHPRLRALAREMARRYARSVDDAHVRRLEEPLAGALPGLSQRRREAVLAEGREDEDTSWTEEILDWARRVLTLWGLRRFASRADSGVDPDEHGGIEEFAEKWLAHINENNSNAQRITGAAIRFGLGVPNDNDGRILREALGEFTHKSHGEDTEMAEINFWVDSRGLPKNDDGSPFDRQAYQDKVSQILEEISGVEKSDSNVVIHAAVTGMLLLDEQFSTDSRGFRAAVKKRWDETLGRTPKFGSPEPVPNREVYRAVAETIASFPGRDVAITIGSGGDDATPAPTDADEGNISVQEFASVSRYVIERGADVPLGHPSFNSQVRIGLDRFVGGAPPFDSLDLPPLTGADGQDVEIEPDNIRAVGMIWAASRLERVRLIHVCDRITELFINGLLPIGFDGGGKLLDTYHWDAEDRLSEPARMMHYSRIVGAPGGDVSREAQPNTGFENHLLRFVSTIIEWYRKNQQSFHPQMHNSEPIRKAGRDLAANASLYGWGGAHFAARRLNAHISQAFTILNEPSIQRAYGVSNPWQVIERVAQAEFGQAPNVVRHRTEAESGKKILDLVAKYHNIWSATSGAPLFAPLDLQFGRPSPSNGDTGVTGFGALSRRPDIPNSDRDEFVVHSQYLVAIRGVGDDEVDQLSEPTEAALAPSVPSYGGFGGQGDMGALNQIRDMVSSGNTPSLDQLKQMLPGLS